MLTEIPTSDMSARGQVSTGAAEVYDRFFLPALFGRWAAIVANAAGVGHGDVVLDVACGTGVLALEASTRVGPSGSVAGLDCNSGMLEQARRKSAEIEWKEGVAEALPFEDGVFDAVVSQFGLMFFVDRVKALSEMRRVLKPGGRLAVAVWASLDETPGYAAMVALLHRLFGAEIANSLKVPYSLGNMSVLHDLCARADMPEAKAEMHEGPAEFPSIDDWVTT
ncbi:MAG: class I SAM-dependent methyltransferase, partial [Oricola sp.]